MLLLPLSALLLLSIAPLLPVAIIATLMFSALMHAFRWLPIAFFHCHIIYATLAAFDYCPRCQRLEIAPAAAITPLRRATLPQPRAFASQPAPITAIDSQTHIAAADRPAANIDTADWPLPCIDY
jgi:hypothetical protein